MHGLFVTCLLGGAVATVLLGVLGTLAGHLHLGHGPGNGNVLHGHVPAAHHGVTGSARLPNHNHSPASGVGRHGGTSTHGGQSSGGNVIHTSAMWALGWLSPLTLAAAALWFGGAGVIFERLGSTPAVLLAVVAAVLGAAVVRSISSAFDRAGTPPLVLTGEGAIGIVNADIRPQAAGEVIYTLEGLSRSCPAQSVDGGTIPRGTEVVIVRRERGMAWVSPLAPIDAVTSKEPVLPVQIPRKDGSRET